MGSGSAVYLGRRDGFKPFRISRLMNLFRWSCRLNLSVVRQVSIRMSGPYPTGRRLAV